MKSYPKSFTSSQSGAEFIIDIVVIFHNLNNTTFKKHSLCVTRDGAIV
jgi:hypothetical protein